MDTLIIESNENSPKIFCDAAINTITIEGESRPENVRQFYAPVFEWISEYEKLLYYVASSSKNQITINLNLNLDYFNSSSLRVFMEIINKLNKISVEMSNTLLNVNWFFDNENEDIIEAGNEFQKISGVSMNFVSK